MLLYIMLPTICVTVQYMLPYSICFHTVCYLQYMLPYSICYRTVYVTIQYVLPYSICYLQYMLPYSMCYPTVHVTPHPHTTDNSMISLYQTVPQYRTSILQRPGSLYNLLSAKVTTPHPLLHTSPSTATNWFRLHCYKDTKELY